MSTSQEFDQESVVVVYDPEGRILHEHHFVTSHGGEHPDEETREVKALAHAAIGGRDLRAAEVLHVDAGTMVEGVRYSVDPSTRALRAPSPER